MTLEASFELERIAAQVREDALLLDLVQSTPMGHKIDKTTDLELRDDTGKILVRWSNDFCACVRSLQTR